MSHTYIVLTHFPYFPLMSGITWRRKEFKADNKFLINHIVLTLFNTPTQQVSSIWIFNYEHHFQQQKLRTVRKKRESQLDKRCRPQKHATKFVHLWGAVWKIPQSWYAWRERGTALSSLEMIFRLDVKMMGSMKEEKVIQGRMNNTNDFDHKYLMDIINVFCIPFHFSFIGGRV